MRKLCTHIGSSDQAMGVHGVHIGQITRMSTLNFGECLRNEIEVPIGDAPNAGDNRAALFPPQRNRYEEVGRGQLDIQL